MEKLYADKRWWMPSKPLDSGCSFCQLYYGFGKCEKYPDGIPRDVLTSSFPEPGKEDRFPTYCDSRQEKLKEG